MSQVVVSGYYGYSNVGDEVVLNSLVSWLRTSGLCDEIAVLSSDPVGTSSRLCVQSVHRYSLLSLIRTFWRSSLVVSGGGSLIQDRTSVRSALYYLAVLALAIALRRRVAVVGQGLGPINSSFVRAMVRAILSRVDYISLRDHGSVSFLQRLGVPDSRIVLGADLAFLSLCPRSAEDELEARARGPIAYVVPSQRVTGTHTSWPAEFARQVNSRMRGQRSVELLAFQPVDAKARDAAAENRRIVRVHEVDQLMKRYCVVVSERLHGLVLAVRAGVPAIALGSDPKIRHFSDEAGLPWKASEGLSPESLGAWVCGRIEKILCSYPESTAATRAVARELHERAQEGLEGLFGLLRCTQGQKTRGLEA